MDGRPKARRRSADTRSVFDTLSKLSIARQGLNNSSVLPDTILQPRPDGAVLVVGNNINKDQSMEEILANAGDLLVTQDAVILNQNVDAAIANAKKLYELSSSAAVKGINSKRGGRKASGGTLFVTKQPSSTRNKQELFGKTQNLRTSSRDPKKSTAVSEVLQSNKPQKTGNVYSLSSQLKKAISVSSISTVAKSASAKATGATSRLYTKAVSDIVKRLGGRDSVSSASLQISTQSKTTSTKPLKKDRSLRRAWKKPSPKKGKSETPVTENTFFTTIHSIDTVHELKKSHSKDKIRRSTKKKGKSSNKLKTSTSEIKINRSIRLTTLSTPRLPVSPSPRSLLQRSVSKLSSNKRFKKARSASKLSVSKSISATKRPTSAMSKPEQPKTFRKTMSVSKLQEQPHQSLSVAKTRINTPTPPVHTLSTPRLQESNEGDKSLNRRSSSALFLREGESEKKRKPKVKKAKSKTLNNANANNVNDIDDEETSQLGSLTGLSLTSVCSDTQTEEEQPGGASAVSFDDLVILSGEINESDNSSTSKYNPQESVTAYLRKSMGKPVVSTQEFENKNTNFSSKITYKWDRFPEGDQVYNMCFMDLVENGFDEDMFQTTSYRSNEHPKPEKQRVRFNLQIAESRAPDLKHGPLKYDSAGCGPSVLKHGPLTYLYRDTDNSAGDHRKQRAVYSPDDDMQLMPKCETKKWPNIWATVLKSKKWRDVYTLVGSRSATDLDTESTNNEETESAERDHHSSAHEISPTSCNTKKTQRKVRKIQRRVRGRRQRESSAGASEHPPSDVVFAPYTWSYNDEGSSELSAEPSSTTPFSFLQSDFADVNASKHSDETIRISVPRLPMCSRRKLSKIQLKWLHLVDHMTTKVQKDCLLKGYEILQRLSRGNPRVHSLIFLANNKSNPAYSPVEIAAIRWPYACFTSSVISLSGSTTDREYIQTWINALPPHPNLVTLLHRFCTDTWVYHVTQHCPWPSLDHLISQSSGRCGPDTSHGLRENACKTIFKQICAAMAHLHQHEVLHGDLNCSNILVNDMLQVKLAGYGPLCQRMMSPIQSIRGHVPLQGDSYSINTPPELMARRDVWTKSCDVWCMGITLLQMVIGEISQEVNSAIRLNGFSNPVAKLHLPNCGYQLSRLIDKILQQNASNRPSVFQISNHPWLCDGTDLASVLWQRKNRNAARRTDGSTFPLPKRLQDPENRLDENYACSESDCSGSDSCDFLESQDKNEDGAYFHSYTSDYLTKLQQEPQSFNKTFYKCGLSDNWLTDKNCLIPSLSSATLLSPSVRHEPYLLKTLSPRFSLISSGTSSPRKGGMPFVNAGLEIEEVGIVNRNGATERPTNRRRRFYNGANDCHDERHRGSDLLKLMENLGPANGNMEIVN